MAFHPVSGAAAARPLLGTLLGAALLTPLPALAEDGADADQDRPIIVTGAGEPDANPNADPNAPFQVERSADDRWTEPLRDTPRSVTAIPREVLEDMGATSFRDVARATPGVTLGTGEGGNAFGDRIFIRGFDARNDVYIDGLRDPGVSSREIFAVEQIEIVRGPSGSFGGRGTTGGLVSLQSRRARLGSDFATIEATVGTEENYRGTLDANVALGDRVALRVAAMGQSADTPGRDYVTSDRYGAALAATARLTDTLTISADYYRYRLDAIPDFGHPFDSLTSQPYAVGRDNFYGVIGRDFLENDADIGTLRIDFDPIDALSIRAIGRYGETANRYLVGTPGAVCRFDRTATGACPTSGTLLPEDQFTVTAGGQRRDAETRTWSALVDATAEFTTGGIGHTLVIGAEYAHERVDAWRLATADFLEDAAGNQLSLSPFIRNLLRPDPVLPGVQPVFRDTSIGATAVRVESLAAYVIDTIRLTDNLRLTGAARIDGYAIRLFNPDASNAAGLQPQRLRSNATLANWQASLLWKPAEPVSLYVSFATSSNPSGEQIDGNGIAYDGLAPQTADLAPERNRSWEAGAKWEAAGGELLLTAALFQITKANAREQTSPGVYALAGELRSRGVELSVAGNLTSRLQLFGAYTYNDATIVQSANAANVGRRFANIPQHSGSLLLTYALTSRVQIGGQVYAQDAFYGGTLAAGTAMVPGYVRFDAVARWRPTDALELRLNVLNLTDRVYYDAIYRSGAPFAYIAPGRSATLTATLSF